ncbi:DUF3137 domain-containing protein [Erythrobacter sp. JK5]|uniref:DUF3137 domain-containing protein n=1 Tax=Erythrobacter sp. JK5 TaxID=2829500 RepID=UPI001BA9C780|nr:DUF3137 domain-containing protein [Erythrobacter sp. JK5]QUL38958.1 DUF3137 domain-containing protein [Erythrobacter sp. JK5]
MVAIPDTDQLMAGPLGQFLEQQRSARSEAKAQAWGRVWKSAIVAAPLMLAFLIFVPIEFTPKIWICGFATTAIFGWTRIPIQQAKKRVKIGINEGIADALGLSYSHDGEAGREFELAKQFDLVPSHQRSHLEDFWTGEIEGHAFLLHEAHLRKKRGSGKNRRWVTVFRGAIIRIASGRSFHGTTLVHRAGQHESWFGLGGRKDSVDFGGHRLYAVDMVHPDFADRFDVWSDDQVEARYLVDPLYVERLLALENAFEGDGVCSLFDKGDIIVAVRGGICSKAGQ